MTDNNHQSSHARLHVFVTGRVQGVFFRAHTKEMAHTFGLSGWVRNLPDGRVETVYEGKREVVDAMTAWLHTGPAMASVYSIDIHEEPCTGAEGDFTIRY